jgi:5-oxoprolinase (ATP-hydrolysing)
VHDNLADLRAAVAANSRGVGAISDLAGALGEESLSECFRSIKRRSAEAVRAWMRSMRSGVYRAEERLDDGSPIRATITVSQDEAIIDLTGSAGVHPGNLNATPAIVRSVIVYLLRVLVRADVPLNEGLLGPVRLVIPTGIFNPEFPPDAARCPAVVGGNVETSQRLVDTLMKALSVGACSQGTMNNVVFGNASISYYETICGGVGAGGAGGIGGRGFHGASAVHSHMTNTRITDCEILETRYPVRLERFTVRRGSGGAGRFRGGDGVVREMVFLEPLLVSVLSQHRVNGPFGLAGGMPGAPGRQRIIRKSGEEITLGSIGQCDVGAGDCLIIETPGGGGYGRSTDA